MHLEFDFRQSFQGELVAEASARICKSTYIHENPDWGATRGTEDGRGPQERNRSEGRGVLWSRTLFLFLRRTSTHLLLSLSHSLSRPLPPPRLVPLNKLVRFNDSYFFLVTRLPSFAPNAPLEKVAVNLVGSPRFLRSLSLSFSPSLSPCCRVFGHEGSP